MHHWHPKCHAILRETWHSLSLIIWYQVTSDHPGIKLKYWIWSSSVFIQLSFKFPICLLNSAAGRPCSCKLLLCSSSDVTQAINGSRNIPSQSVSKLLDYASSVRSGGGDPDQGQLSWDHQDPSDKNLDCNEWKHWNGSQSCGRRGHVMLEWLVQEMVRTNLFSGRHDPSLSLVSGRP